MNNCKHNNNPATCQQCQYGIDVASGYPFCHSLWFVVRGGKRIKQCTRTPKFESKIYGYERRHDADQIIAEWKQGQNGETETAESVLLGMMNAHIFRVNQLAEQADDVASCIPDWIGKLIKSLRSELVNKGANSCRLCVKYRPAKCVGCPIFEDIENPTCIDAPEEKKGLISAYSAIEMIEYLIRLERKLRTHPLLKPDKCATCRHSYEKKEG
jgi:hypothetical protein